MPSSAVWCKLKQVISTASFGVDKDSSGRSPLYQPECSNAGVGMLMAAQVASSQTLVCTTLQASDC